jgi:hypothetical protein
LEVPRQRLLTAWAEPFVDGKLKGERDGTNGTMPENGYSYCLTAYPIAPFWWLRSFLLDTRNATAIERQLRGSSNECQDEQPTGSRSLIPCTLQLGKGVCRSDTFTVITFGPTQFAPLTNRTMFGSYLLALALTALSGESAAAM